MTLAFRSSSLCRSSSAPRRPAKLVSTSISAWLTPVADKPDVVADDGAAGACGGAGVTVGGGLFGGIGSAELIAASGSAAAGSGGVAAGGVGGVAGGAGAPEG